MKIIDAPDEREVTREEEMSAALGEPDALCLARGGWFDENGDLHRTGRCVSTIEHDGDHSWGSHHPGEPYRE